jgi:hypothetical protein
LPDIDTAGVVYAVLVKNECLLDVVRSEQSHVDESPLRNDVTA